jgi:hypothetical protein
MASAVASKTRIQIPELQASNRSWPLLRFVMSEFFATELSGVVRSEQSGRREWSFLNNPSSFYTLARGRKRQGRVFVEAHGME